MCSFSESSFSETGSSADSQLFYFSIGDECIVPAETVAGASATVVDEIFLFVFL